MLTGRVAAALRICAVLSVLGGGIAWLTVGREPGATPARPADLLFPCYDPCTPEDAESAA